MLTEQERKRLVAKEVEIDVPRQIIVEQDQAGAAAVINTVTESISAPGSSKSKGDSSSSSICGTLPWRQTITTYQGLKGAAIMIWLPKLMLVWLEEGLKMRLN